MRKIKALISKTVILEKSMELEIPDNLSEDQIKNLIEDKIYHSGISWDTNKIIDITTSWKNL